MVKQLKNDIKLFFNENEYCCKKTPDFKTKTANI